AAHLAAVVLHDLAGPRRAERVLVPVRLVALLIRHQDRALEHAQARGNARRVVQSVHDRLAVDAAGQRFTPEPLPAQRIATALEAHVEVDVLPDRAEANLDPQ